MAFYRKIVFVLLIVLAATVGADPVMKGQCRLDPRPSVEYWCMDPDGGSRLCRDLEPAGTRVYPKCRPNYYSQSDLAFMRCLGGRWDYIATCLPDCGRVTPHGMRMVVGGERVRRGELPWHAGIYTKTIPPNTTSYEYQQVCGGTLVSTKVVISAAHCFWSDLEKQLPASQFAVAVGKLYRPWGDPMDHESQQSDVTAIHLPVRYKGATTNYQDDIAVLVVTREFQYGNCVRPICLSFNYLFEATQLNSRNRGKVAGWGLTAPNGKPSPVLMVVEMPYVELGICFSESPFSFQQYITSDKICAGTLENNTALCKGDSGGGLVFSASTMGVERYYLRGVVSSAPAPTSENLCNTASYTTFTLLTKHEYFVKQFWTESGEFHCVDGSFITSGKQCDGAIDCADGSDETNDACATNSCSEFRCAYGACVDRGAICNGVRDCADGSDEAGSPCGEITTNKSEAVSLRVASLPCILPPYPEHGAYSTDIAGAEPGQGYDRVTLSDVTCERGYVARGSTSREFSCSLGVWTGIVPRCVSICSDSLTSDDVSGYEFSAHNEDCYKFHTWAASWEDANRTCVVEGAQLAVANSAAEERVLVELYQRYRAAITNTKYTSAVFVGIYRQSGVWRTVDGQTLAQAGRAHWARGYPIHDHRHSYGSMTRTGSLYNTHGAYKRAFICEMA